MKKVNPYFLDVLLGPFTGLADDDSAVEAYRDLDPNNGARMREIIRREVVPHFGALSPKARERAKLALRYYLSRTSVDFEHIFEACLPPFDPPDDPRLFFVWLWEELLPGESYELSDMDEYREVPDIHEPNRY